MSPCPNHHRICESLGNACRADWAGLWVGGDRGRCLVFMWGMEHWETAPCEAACVPGVRAGSILDRGGPEWFCPKRVKKRSISPSRCGSGVWCLSPPSLLPITDLILGAGKRWEPRIVRRVRELQRGMSYFLITLGHAPPKVILSNHRKTVQIRVPYLLHGAWVSCLRGGKDTRGFLAPTPLGCACGVGWMGREGMVGISSVGGFRLCGSWTGGETVMWKSRRVWERLQGGCWRPMCPRHTWQ